MYGLVHPIIIWDLTYSLSAFLFGYKMSLIDILSDRNEWERFYEYKMSLVSSEKISNELRQFIDEGSYMKIYDQIKEGKDFPLPVRKIISKMGSDKKRAVYTYPKGHNMVLKFLTWLILRKYDYLFSKGLYSFRPGRTAKDAFRRLLRVKGIENMYAYKVDIHDYFNSIPVDKILPMIKKILQDDEELYDFLSMLLNEPFVIEKGQKVKYMKGIMAGTPLSSFYANVYLSGLDLYFEKQNVIYCRYSDDIIVFASDEEELSEYRRYIIDYLERSSLEVNPSKEVSYRPEEGFTFLGFSYLNGIVDIAQATLKKLIGKMRRKRDSLSRWAKRNGTEGEKAAKAFIRIFNRKLFECHEENELSWSKWFFPVINTDESLHKIDLYAQDCIRFLISGKHTKSRFNVKYEDMKNIGYRSLVHEFYDSKK